MVVGGVALALRGIGALEGGGLLGKELRVGRSPPELGGEGGGQAGRGVDTYMHARVVETAAQAVGCAQTQTAQVK